MDIKIAYLILAHDKEQNVVRLIQKILSGDSAAEIFIHFDASAASSSFEFLKLFCIDKNSCTLLDKRVKCGWGEYGIVEASLLLLERARHKAKFDYFYLLSGSCYPIKPMNDLKIFLASQNGHSFIECESSSWILAGMRDDRYRYYHFLNFRKNPQLFRFFYKLQRKIGVERSLPRKIYEIKFGSQWWCLSSYAVEELLNFLNDNQEYIKFFKTTWIPDECFFQTLIWALVPKDVISSSLTYYKFDDSGKPKVFNSTDESSKIELENKFFLRKLV